MFHRHEERNAFSELACDCPMLQFWEEFLLPQFDARAGGGIEPDHPHPETARRLPKRFGASWPEIRNCTRIDMMITVVEASPAMTAAPSRPSEQVDQHSIWDTAENR